MRDRLVSRISPMRRARALFYANAFVSARVRQRAFHLHRTAAD
jgi:hypothetical protein